MIKKGNMKSKNRDQDQWRSHLRTPYEKVFSYRFRGLAQVQFQVTSRAICHNFKRLIVLGVNKYPLPYEEHSQNPSALYEGL